jgi:superfamily II DNA helicase RecQ
MEVKQAIDRVAKMYDYTELKMEQLDILHHFITGNDVFGCLPTGFGKRFALYFYQCFLMLFLINILVAVL